MRHKRPPPLALIAALAAVAVAGGPAWCQDLGFGYPQAVDAGEGGSWYQDWRYFGGTTPATAYHMWVWGDTFEGAGIAILGGWGLDTSSWGCQLVAADYTQMWANDFPENANGYDNPEIVGDGGSAEYIDFRHYYAGAGTETIYVALTSAYGDPRDLNYGDTWLYKHEGAGWWLVGHDVDGPGSVPLPESSGYSWDDSTGAEPPPVIPELGTWALLLATGAVGGWIRRRRK